MYSFFHECLHATLSIELRLFPDLASLEETYNGLNIKWGLCGFKHIGIEVRESCQFCQKTKCQQAGETYN